jgi:hypothetical protein
MGNTVKGVLLLAGLMFFVGSVSALEGHECARYVKKPGDSIVLRDAHLPTGTLGELAEYIDVDVLDLNYELNEA